jgi:hypothetical protein
LTIDGVNHATVIRGTSKLFLDGNIGVGGDTYIQEVSANSVDIYAGGVRTLAYDNTTTYFILAPTFSATNSTGAVATNLSNAPTGTTATPYKWVSVMSADGTACWLPLWKK